MSTPRVWIVRLPAAVQEPFQVYVNGVPQRAGVDYERRGKRLLFERPLAKEGKLGFWRWTSIVFGVAGTYRQNDVVDVIYESAAGGRTVASNLPVVP